VKKPNSCLSAATTLFCFVIPSWLIRKRIHARAILLGKSEFKIDAVERKHKLLLVETCKCWILFLMVAVSLFDATTDGTISVYLGNEPRIFLGPCLYGMEFRLRNDETIICHISIYISILHRHLETIGRRRGMRSFL
jgi:hypothetical protein